MVFNLAVTILNIVYEIHKKRNKEGDARISFIQVIFRMLDTVSAPTKGQVNSKKSY